MQRIMSIITSALPIMLAVCSILSYNYYAQNYAGIIGWSLGTTGEELVQSTMWWNGPAFLQLNQDKWPQSEISLHMDRVIQSELVKNPLTVSYAFSITSVDAVYLLNSVIDCTYFSNIYITPLLRVTALVLCCASLKSLENGDRFLINDAILRGTYQFN